MSKFRPSPKGNEEEYSNRRRDRIYRFGVEYENLHAGDVLKHPVDVVTHRRNQHHRFTGKFSATITSSDQIDLVDFCLLYNEAAAGPALYY